MGAGALCVSKQERSPDIMYEVAIGAAINLILAFIKNPQHRQAMRNAMLKIYRVIQAAYPNDPEFASTRDLASNLP